VDRYEFFSGLPRTEPGGTIFTSAYLSFVQLQRSDRILDLRTGTGERAVWICRSRVGEVVAVDQDPRFCRLAQSHALDGGTGGRMQAVCARYNALPFSDESFSLVIAEWAPITLGLKASLQLWRRLVPVGGLLAISYPGVVNRDAPKEVRGPIELRMAEPMATLNDYQSTARSLGYEMVHQATLGHHLWQNFYADTTRRAWALAGRDENNVSGAIRSILDEANWYRNIGRGRVFLQSMLLRRTR